MDKTQLAILITTTTAIGVTILKAWMDTTIKFAPTETQARRAIRLILLRLVNGIVNVGVAVWLVWEFVSSEPLTRATVFRIVLLSLVLFNTYILWWVSSIFDLIYSHRMATLETTREILGLSEKHLGMTEEIRGKFNDLLDVLSGKKKSP